MKDRIVNWIKDYATKHNKTALIVGVSGGIDRAVVSALCAETGQTTIPVVLSINNADYLAHEHIRWLDDNYTNIDWKIVYKDYGACLDFPSCNYYKELMKAYPDAKVILTVRDAKSWITSWNVLNNQIFLNYLFQ